MQANTRGWQLVMVGLITALVSLGGENAALAQTVTAPAVSSGDYSVTYTCNDCVYHWLEERIEGGSWRQVNAGTFAGKTPGTYYYRVGYYFWLDPITFDLIAAYGAEARVIVGAELPPVDPIGSQLKYQYETRVGDGNGDGLLDLFVQRVAGGTSGNGVIEALLLLQSGGAVMAAVPSPAQQSLAATWPRSVANVVLGDYNVDGFVDLKIGGLGSAIGAAGVHDQLVYSPGRLLASAPLGIRATDDALERFVLHAHDYLADGEYFRENAPYVTVFVAYYYYDCTSSWDYDYGYGGSCTWFPYYVPVVVQDYSVFSPQALEAWTQESAIQRGAVSQEQGQEAIKRAFESAIGVKIGGWDFNGVRAEDAALDAPRRRGFELFLSVLGIFDAQAAELGRESRRRSEVVYITGRRILGFLPTHTALEYNGSTISAFDGDAGWPGSGLLISQVNWPSDQPPLTMTLGTVSWSLGAPLYWQQLLIADARYRDNLPYSAVPSLADGAYNSNGYVHGIVRATAGVPSIDLNGFVGGDKPVPPSVFY